MPDWIGCNVCGWEPQDWPSDREKMNESAWHIYEEHPFHWSVIVGCRKPRDPDPRKMSHG